MGTGNQSPSILIYPSMPFHGEVLVTRLSAIPVDVSHLI